MQEILKAIRDLYDMLVVRLKKVDDEKAAQARDRDAFAKRCADLDIREADVVKREAAVKKIEDVVALTNKIKTDLEVIADKEAKFVRAKDEFERSCMARDRALKDLEDQMKVKIRKLEERETTLKENERTYKDKILTNLRELKKS